MPFRDNCIIVMGEFSLSHSPTTCHDICHDIYVAITILMYHVVYLSIGIKR